MATAPTTPPAAGPALTDPPSTADPENFDPEGDAFLGALPAFQIEMNAAKENVFTNADVTYDNAVEAAASAVTATAMADTATALANFKGAWSALTGVLNKPASVLHNSAYWVLLNNLANVVLSEPGVSADWSEAGVTSVNGMRGAVVIEASVADALYLNQQLGAF